MPCVGRSEVEHEAVGLPWSQAGPAADHLRVEGAALRGAGDGNAGRLGGVEALGEEGAVHEHLDVAGSVEVEDALALGLGERAVEGGDELRAAYVGTQDASEFVGDLDRRGEHDGLSVATLRGDGCGHLMELALALHGLAQVLGGQVAPVLLLGGPNRRQVDARRVDGQGPDGREEPFADGCPEVVLV